MAFYSDPASGGNPNALLGIWNEFRQGGGLDQSKAAYQGQQLQNTETQQRIDATAMENKARSAALPEQIHTSQQVGATRQAMNDMAANAFQDDPVTPADPDEAASVMSPPAQPWGTPVTSSLVDPAMNALQNPATAPTAAQPPLADRIHPALFNPATAPFYSTMASAPAGSPVAQWKAKMDQYFDGVDPKDVPAHYNQMLTALSSRAAPPVMSDLQRNMMQGSSNGGHMGIVGNNDDGSPKIGMLPDDLTPDQEVQANRHPVAALASAPFYQKEKIAAVSAAATAQQIQARKDFAENSKVASAFGTKENPGILQIQQAMNDGAAKYTDPKTGAVDWEALKKNGPAAFHQMFNYFKSMAPNQVIRGTELEELKKTYGLDATAPNFWDKLFHGAIIPPGVLDNMKQEVDSQAQTARQNVYDAMDATASRYLNPQNPQASPVTAHDLVDDPRFNDAYDQYKQAQQPPTGPGSADTAQQGPVMKFPTPEQADAAIKTGSVPDNASVQVADLKAGGWRVVRQPKQAQQKPTIPGKVKQVSFAPKVVSPAQAGQRAVASAVAGRFLPQLPFVSAY